MNKILLYALLLFTCVLKAQMMIDNTTQTPAQLVQNVLVGGGVAPFNIKFNGATGPANVVRDQVGEFTTGFYATNLGLNNGLLLTTGNAQYALGPNTSHNNLGTGQMPSITAGGSDPDLALLSGATISSSAVLEFDFVSTGLILNFDFVFGSEEYAGYVNSINDSFGFFLSGPGITGPYSGNAKNIALVPSTNTQISINTINNGPNNNGTCTNCAYYFNNSPTGVNPNLSATETVEYDGFTRGGLRATSPLQCGETYHIKLAIGNVSDDLLDSGVFIRNFRIPPLELLDNLGLNDNLGVCYGEIVTLYSGLTIGANHVEWYKDGVLIPGEVGPNLTVTADGVYTLKEFTPTGCQIASDDIHIAFLPQLVVTAPQDITICTGIAPSYTVNIDQNSLILTGIPAADQPNYSIKYYEDPTDAANDAATNINLNSDADLATFTFSGTIPKTIYVRIQNLIGASCAVIKQFNIDVTAPSGTFSYDGSPYCNNLTTGQAVTNHSLTSGGTYTISPAGVSIDPVTGAIIPFGAAPGPYTVNYDIPATAGCIAFHYDTSFTVQACTCTVVASSTSETLCEGSALTPITYTTAAGASSVLITSGSLPPGITGTLTGGVYTLSGTATTAGSYPFTVEITSGVDVCSTGTTITVVAQPDAGLDGTPLAVCDSSTTPIDLYSLITGEQTGGTWTRLTGTGGNFDPIAGTYTPAPGATSSTFKYLILATSPCNDDFSIATINILAQPYAGIAAAPEVICDSSTAVIDLYSLITGEQSGGTWTQTGGAGGTFNALAGTLTPSAGIISSTFDYTLTGTLPCVNSVSTATVTVNSQPYAGVSAAAVTVCDSSTASIDLYGLITGEQTGGTWARLTGTGGSFDATLGTFTPSPGATNSTFEYTLVGTAPCLNSSSIATININAQPDAGIAGTAEVVCNSSTTPIDLYSLISGEQTGGTWIRSTGTGGTFNAIAATFTPDVTATSSTFTYTITGSSPCVNSSSVGTVTVNAQPDAGTAGAPMIVCNTSTTPINLFNLIVGEQPGGLWTRAIGSGGTLDAVTGIFTPSGDITTISTVFTYTVTGTFPCVDALSSASVAIIPQPDAGTSVAPITVCDNSTTAIDLYGLITGEQPGGTWTRLTGTGGTFNAAAGTYIPAVGATNSTFEYTLIGASPCVNDSSVVTINITPQPDAGVSAAPQVICDSSTTTINLYNLITGEQAGGTWSRTLGVGGTFNALAGTFTPAPGATSSTFDYTITGVAPCVNSISTATITINAQPDAGVSAAPLAVCDNNTTLIDLYSLIAGEQTGGTWTRLTGTGGVFDPILGTFTPSSGATNSTFEYLILGTAPCVNDSSIVTINITAQPDAGASGAPLVICDSSTTPIDLYSLITGEQAGGTWTRNTGTGGTFNALAGTFTPAAGATSSTFTYTLTGVAPCSNSTSSATITINAQPDAGVDGAPITVCDNSTTPIDLYSLIIGEQTGGTWIRSSGTGGIFNALAGTFTPSAGATNSTFKYTILGTAPCVNVSSNAIININAQPDAGVDGTPLSVCENSTAVIDLYSLITGEQSGGSWSRLTGTGGTFNALAGTYIPAAGASSSSFKYTITGVAPCTNVSSVARVNINPQPDAGLDGPPKVVCESSNAAIDLYGLINGEQTGGTWSRTSGTGGVFNALAGTFTPGIGATSSTFKYTILGTTPCVDSSSTATININAQPDAGTSGAPITVCDSSTATIDLYSLITGEQPGGIWTRLTGTGGTFNALAGTFTPALGATSSTFKYTLTGVSPCIDDSSIASITVNPAATITLISGQANQGVCINTAVATTTYQLGNGATGVSLVTGGYPLGVNGILNAVVGTFTISGTALSSGVFDYTLTTTGGCPSAPITGRITVNQDVNLVLLPDSGTISPKQCMNDAIVPIKYSITNGATGATVSGLPTGITGSYSSGVFIISGSSAAVGVYNYTVSTVGGCGLDTKNGTIIIRPDATIALTSAALTDSQRLCIHTPITDITYQVDNEATGASITLGQVPIGILGGYNAGTRTFTISGTPTESGVFHYTIATTGGCHVATLTGTINVDPLPVVNLPQDGFICVDELGVPIPGGNSSFDLTTNLSTSSHNFVWSDASGVIPTATGNSYTVTVPGTYHVEVTNTTTHCSSSASATVVPSLPPATVSVATTSYFEDNQTVVITVTPAGDYEYQLDDGPFQDSNVFDHLFSGEHHVLVQDKFGCGFRDDHFRIVNYPKFFTPNNDGYNDTWNIFELQDQPSIIYIYDRYGKLVKQISTQGLGWDGTFNGKLLPSTDYWFKVFYTESGKSKEFRAHFSLKR